MEETLGVLLRPQNQKKFRGGNSLRLLSHGGEGVHCRPNSGITTLWLQNGVGTVVRETPRTNQWDECMSSRGGWEGGEGRLQVVIKQESRHLFAVGRFQRGWAIWLSIWVWEEMVRCFMNNYLCVMV